MLWLPHPNHPNNENLKTKLFIIKPAGQFDQEYPTVAYIPTLPSSQVEHAKAILRTLFPRFPGKVGWCRMGREFVEENGSGNTQKGFMTAHGLHLLEKCSIWLDNGTEVQIFTLHDNWHPNKPKDHVASLIWRGFKPYHQLG